MPNSVAGKVHRPQRETLFEQREKGQGTVGSFTYPQRGGLINPRQNGVSFEPRRRGVSHFLYCHSDVVWKEANSDAVAGTRWKRKKSCSVPLRQKAGQGSKREVISHGESSGSQFDHPRGGCISEGTPFTCGKNLINQGGEGALRVIRLYSVSPIISEKSAKGLTHRLIRL